VAAAAATVISLSQTSKSTKKDSDVGTMITPTLEPMLYNVPLLALFTKILNDTSIVSREEYQDLLDFARSIVRHFGRLATSNPVLYIEALFQQPYVHAFCETAQTHYIDPTRLHTLQMVRSSQVSEELEEQSRSNAAGMEPHLGREAQEHRREGVEEEEEEEEEEEFDLEKEAEVRPAKPRKRRRSLTGEARKHPRRAAAASAWTAEEDRVLQEEFSRYQGIESVYEILAEHDALKTRSVLQLRRRVAHLGLGDGVPPAPPADTREARGADSIDQAPDIEQPSYFAALARQQSERQAEPGTVPQRRVSDDLDPEVPGMPQSQEAPGSSSESPEHQQKPKKRLKKRSVVKRAAVSDLSDDEI
jgi:hypothetical protein